MCVLEENYFNILIQCLWSIKVNFIKLDIALNMLPTQEGRVF